MERVKKGLRAALAASVLVGTAPADISKAKDLRTPRIEQIQQESLSQGEMDFLMQNVYHEARGESFKGQLAVAQVTIRRLLSGKYGKNIIDVVWSPHQYSWTHDPKILMSSIDEKKLGEIRTNLSFIIANQPALTALQRLSEITGIPMNAEFYKRTDWNEHDPDEKRMSEGTKKMFRDLLTPVGVLDKHTFYADLRGEKERRLAKN